MERLKNVVSAFEQGNQIGKSIAGNLAFGYGLYKAYQYGAFSVEGLVATAGIAAIGYIASCKAEATKIDENRSVLDMAKSMGSYAENFGIVATGLVSGSIFAAKQIILPEKITETASLNDSSKQGAVFFKNVLHLTISVGLGLGLESVAQTIGLGLTSFESGPKICRLASLAIGGYAATKALETKTGDSTAIVISETAGTVLWAAEKIKNFTFDIKDFFMNGYARVKKTVNKAQEIAETLEATASAIRRSRGASSMSA